MSISKKFYSIVLAIIAVFALVGCQMPTSFSRTVSEAEADLAYVADSIFFTEDDLTVASNLFFTTSTGWAEKITFEWSSSNEAVIATDGTVTRPEYGLGNAEVTVKVVITAEYTKLDDGTFKPGTVSTEKEWTFTVLEAGKVYTIADIKNDLTFEADVTEVSFQGTVVALSKYKGANYPFVYDGTDGMYVFIDSPEVKVGDYVQVNAKYDVYYNLVQVSDGGVTVLESGVELPAVEKGAISDVVAAKGYMISETVGVAAGKVHNVDAKVVVETSGGYTNAYLQDPFTGERFIVHYETGFDYVPGTTAETYLDLLKAYDGKYVNITVVNYDRKDGEERVCLSGYEIVEIEEPKLTDEQQATIIINGVALESEYREDFDLPATVKWEVVSGTGIELVEGKAVVTRAAADQVVVLKATATYNEVKVSKEFTVTVAAFAAPKFKLDTPYHFAMVQGNTGQTLYLTGEMDGFYYATTEDVAGACEVVIKATDGGYYIIAKGQYMAVVKSGTYTNVKFYATLEEAAAAGTDAVWTWNGTHLITNAGGTDYFLGTKSSGTYTTFSACAVGTEAFAGEFYEIAVSLPFELNTPYHYVMVQANAGKTVYIKGGMNGFYFETTENIADAADLIITSAGAGYYLTVNGEYIGVVVSGTYVNSVYYKSIEEANTAGADLVWSWNGDLKSFTMMVNDQEYVLGTRNDKTYTTVGPVLVSKDPFIMVLTEKGNAPVGPEVPTHEHKPCEICGACLDPECPETKCDGHAPVVEPEGEFKEGQAYKLSMNQTLAGKVVYFIGSMNGFYYATSTNVNDAVNVYVEIVAGGYHLYFLNSSNQKQYLNMVEAMGTDGKMHVNAVYGSEALTVLTYSKELKTFVTVLSDVEYCFGTRNDKTYTTIGTSATSYAPFAIELVIVGGEVEVPTHEHKPCEVCGACLDPECPEAKCEGHEPVVEPEEGETTVEWSAADHGYGYQEQVLFAEIDGNVSMTIAGGANSGKFYTDHIRVYATDTPAGTITFAAKEGYVIKSITFELATGTYAFLQLDGVTVENGQVVEINASTVTFDSVKNGSNGKQVRLYGVTIVYEVPHTHKPCEICGACLDANCSETKCEGHAPVETTVEWSAADHGYGYQEQVLFAEIDGNVSMTIAGGANSGKFYTDHIRVYATDTPAGTITFAAKEGYVIKSITFELATGTYAFLQLDGVTVENGQVVEINASTVTFDSVKNGSNGKQVRLYGVTIVYEAE